MSLAQVVWKHCLMQFHICCCRLPWQPEWLCCGSHNICPMHCQYLHKDHVVKSQAMHLHCMWMHAASSCIMLMYIPSLLTHPSLWLTGQGLGNQISTFSKAPRPEQSSSLQSPLVAKHLALQRQYMLGSMVVALHNSLDWLWVLYPRSWWLVAWRCSCNTQLLHGKEQAWFADTESVSFTLRCQFQAKVCGRQFVLCQMHDAPCGDHVGIKKTRKATEFFYTWQWEQWSILISQSTLLAAVHTAHIVTTCKTLYIMHYHHQASAQCFKGTYVPQHIGLATAISASAAHMHMQHHPNCNTAAAALAESELEKWNQLDVHQKQQLAADSAEAWLQYEWHCPSCWQQYRCSTSAEVSVHCHMGLLGPSPAMHVATSQSSLDSKCWKCQWQCSLVWEDWQVWQVCARACYSFTQ